MKSIIWMDSRYVKMELTESRLSRGAGIMDEGVFNGKVNWDREICY